MDALPIEEQSQFDNTPVAVVAPVAEASRVKLIDALRGVALLGILLMNIPSFSMPDYFWESFSNDPSKFDFWLNAFITVIFEGKMRAMFGMVFERGCCYSSCQRRNCRQAGAWFVLLANALAGSIWAHSCAFDTVEI
jgi:uncharacterized protein